MIKVKQTKNLTGSYSSPGRSLDEKRLLRKVVVEAKPCLNENAILTAGLSGLPIRALVFWNQVYTGNN